MRERRAPASWIGMTLSLLCAGCLSTTAATLPERPLVLPDGRFEAAMEIGVQRASRDRPNALPSFVDVGAQLRTAAHGFEISGGAVLGLYAPDAGMTRTELDELDRLGLGVRRRIVDELTLGLSLDVLGPSSEDPQLVPMVGAAYKLHAAPWLALGLGVEVGMDRFDGDVRAQLQPIDHLAIEAYASAAAFEQADNPFEKAGVHVVVPVTDELDAIAGCDVQIGGLEIVRCGVGLVVQSERPQLGGATD